MAGLKITASQHTMSSKELTNDQSNITFGNYFGTNYSTSLCKYDDQAKTIFTAGHHVWPIFLALYRGRFRVCPAVHRVVSCVFQFVFFIIIYGSLNTPSTWTLFYLGSLCVILLRNTLHVFVNCVDYHTSCYQQPTWTIPSSPPATNNCPSLRKQPL